MPQVTIKKLKDGRFSVSFAYNPTIINSIRTIPTRKWDVGQKCWLFPDTPEIREKIRQIFKGYHIIENNPVPGAQEFERLLKEMQSLKYSRNTIKAYLFYNKELLAFCHKPVDSVVYQDIVDFLAYLATERDYNESGLNICKSRSEDSACKVSRREAERRVAGAAILVP